MIAVFPSLAIILLFGTAAGFALETMVWKGRAAVLLLFLVSRTGAGELYRSVGAFPGSERDLLDAGLIPCDALDGLKARVLVSLLLASGVTRGELETRIREA